MNYRNVSEKEKPMLARKRLLITIAVILIVPAVAFAWWLLSPLLISKTVEEEFPLAFKAVVPSDMTLGQVEQIMADSAAVDNEVSEPMPAMTGKAPDLSAPGVAPSGVQIESDIKDFVLEDMTVNVGDTVLWTNQDGAPHTVSAGSPRNATGEWDSGRLPQNESFSFTFTEAGEFAYFCKIHPDSMKAVVRVESSSTTASSAPTPGNLPSTSAEDGPVMLKAGDFRDADNFHKGSGKATIYQGPDGSRLLRLEEFSVTNGPELHVILSPHPDPGTSGDVKTDGYVDLGKIKGNKGNQNYPIPDGVDTSRMESVIIYCKPFNVIFSVAALSSN